MHNSFTAHKQFQVLSSQKVEVALNNAKMWILITGIVVIVSGFLLYFMIHDREIEKASFMVKIQELNGRLLEIDKLKADLGQAKKEQAELEARSKADFATLDTLVTDSKKSEALLRGKVDTLLKEKDSLTKYVANSTIIVAKLNKKIESLEQERNQVLSESKLDSSGPPVPRYIDPMSDSSEPVLTATPAPKGMGAKLAEEGVVDLGRIIVHPSTHEAARVENVNPLYGFIVLSAGTNDGLRKDSVVNITRNNRLIAKAVVKKAREDVSSAVTLPEWTREEIRVGDFISINAPSSLPN